MVDQTAHEGHPVPEEGPRECCRRAVEEVQRRSKWLPREGEPLSLDDYRAIKLRWATGPEQYQQDADALIATIEALRTQPPTRPEITADGRCPDCGADVGDECADGRPEEECRWLAEAAERYGIPTRPEVAEVVEAAREAAECRGEPPPPSEPYDRAGEIEALLTEIPLSTGTGLRRLIGEALDRARGSLPDSLPEPSDGRTAHHVRINDSGDKPEVWKRCARCEAIYQHLISIAYDPYEDHPEPDLGCRHGYEEMHGRAPPEEIAALAFALPGEVEL